MTASIALLSLALVLALGAGAVALRAHRRAEAAARRRAEAFDRLADMLTGVLAELDDLPWPGPGAAPVMRQGVPEAAPRHPGERRTPLTDPVTGLPARAALVDDLDRRVDQARQSGQRLGLALVAVDGGGPTLERTIARVARVLHDVAPGTEAYRAGERTLALVVPDAGRADALAAVARLEASLDGAPRVTSRATELRPGDDTAELLSRVLSATG